MVLVIVVLFHSRLFVLDLLTNDKRIQIVDISRQVSTNRQMLNWLIFAVKLISI